MENHLQVKDIQNSQSSQAWLSDKVHPESWQQDAERSLQNPPGPYRAAFAPVSFQEKHEDFTGTSWENHDLWTGGGYLL